MILIRNIKTDKDDIKSLERKLSKILKMNNFKYEIYRKSIDARKGIIFNYQVIVDVDYKIASKIKDAVIYNEEEYTIDPPVSKKNVIIVGSGPAGLFSAYTLAKNDCKVLVIERGEDIDKRVKTVDDFFENGKLKLNSNIQFGEGGAGTFSDGKLTARSKDKRVRSVLKTLVEYGAPKEILYEQKPHVGTDILREVIKKVRQEIIALGGEFLFESKLEDIQIENGEVVKIIANSKEYKADEFVLAVGNSSRDTFRMLSKKIKMENKPLAVGFRIEHLQDDIGFSQYKKSFEKLPPATYNLTYNNKDLKLSGYTFCMCPGGYVVNGSSEKEMLCVNGMSYYKRDNINANSALIVTINESIYGKELLASLDFQEKIEREAYIRGGSNYSAPVQRVGDYINNKKTTKLGKVSPTIKPSYTLSNLRGIYPRIIDDMIVESLKNMDNTLKGFASEDAILTGVETRTSSPIRMIRDENLKSLGLKNLYVIGEGAGYSGGIVSSAIDGLKSAEVILKGKL